MIRNHVFRRRGLAIPEWFCILGVLAVGSFVLWATFGESVGDYTNTTADAVADPSRLLSHPAFQSTSGAGGGRQSGGSQGGDSQGRGSGSRGNNGVGNGEDGQPPGEPPINDGPGTGPGNPGNQGGAQP